jgi:hypothetical protein
MEWLRKKVLEQLVQAQEIKPKTTHTNLLIIINSAEEVDL